MKTLLILTICVLLSIKFTYSQDQTQASQNKIQKSVTLADSAKKSADVVVNMEMIESFRRCYDKIEVIDWAYLFKGASADEMGTIFIAYRLMQTNPDVNNNTQSLAIEVQNVKEMITTSTSVKNEQTEKATLTAADLDTNNTVALK